MDFIDSIVDGLGELFDFSDATDSLSDFTDGIDLGDTSNIFGELAQGNFADNCSDDFYSSMQSAMGNFMPPIDDSVIPTDQSSIGDAMGSGLSASNDNDMAEFICGDYSEPENGDISFTGSGDKYTDNAYNQSQYDKWMDIYQEKLSKGDTSGAQAALATAKDHLRRIKN